MTNYLPKAIPLITVPLGVSISAYTFWGTQHVIHNTVDLLRGATMQKQKEPVRPYRCRSGALYSGQHGPRLLSPQKEYGSEEELNLLLQAPVTRIFCTRHCSRWSTYHLLADLLKWWSGSTRTTWEKMTIPVNTATSLSLSVPLPWSSHVWPLSLPAGSFHLRRERLWHGLNLKVDLDMVASLDL